ncbi:LYR motif-containing protein 4 [Anopheles nili]|uniref:LYR motif-containing protein 4 n=1 Tax=Anopheles nili TaxID=185578 RepID=UPI00237B2C31|nr:LYR motif-containing protein 4 [Anopheles nili]
MAVAGHKMKVLSLYKQLLRASQKFDSYNYRMYALRRIRDAFRENKSLADNTTIANELAFAQKNLEIIQRQTIVGHLYRAPIKLVIEK